MKREAGRLGKPKPSDHQHIVFTKATILLPITYPLLINWVSPFLRRVVGPVAFLAPYFSINIILNSNTKPLLLPALERAWIEQRKAILWLRNKSPALEVEPPLVAKAPRPKLLSRPRDEKALLLPEVSDFMLFLLSRISLYLSNLPSDHSSLCKLPTL